MAAINTAENIIECIANMIPYEEGDEIDPDDARDVLNALIEAARNVRGGVPHKPETDALTAALEQAIEKSGWSLAGPADFRAAENGEPKWVCNARGALARIAIAKGA